MARFCSLCQEDDVSTEAVSWCLECEDWLCIDCEKYHGRSKILRHHKIITVAVYDTLPLLVLKISNRCAEHNDVFDQFCSFHETPCCAHCVSKSHRTCELNPLADALRNTKKSSAISQLEIDLNEIIENFKVIENHLLEQLANTTETKTHCINEIELIRTSVNEHLDKIERELLDELSQKENNIKKNIDILTKQIESKKQTVSNLQDSLKNAKQHATDLQLFLSIKKIEKQAADDLKYLEELENGDQMDDKTLEIGFSPELKTLHEHVLTFGNASVTSLPSTLKLTRTSKCQAQQSLSTVSVVDSVNLMTLNTCKPLHIAACAILPTWEYVIADYDRLLFYNSKKTYVRDIIKMSEPPSDMCYLKDSLVAISLPNGAKIHIVDVYQNKIVKTKQMRHHCYGIDSDDGKIFVGLPEVSAVDIMDMDCKKLKSVIILGTNITRFAFYKNHIYCTNNETNEVFCYTINGQMVWTHKYDVIEPWSIAIDKRSSIIYVAGYSSDSLFAISLNGIRSKKVLSEKDGLKGIKSIKIENSQLICSQLDGVVHLFHL